MLNHSNNRDKYLNADSGGVTNKLEFSSIILNI